jgi:HSP20 family protein
MALPIQISHGVVTDPFDSLQRDFDSVFGRFLTNGRAKDGHRLAPYGVDVREDADHLYVEAELPGFKKEEVDITLENQTLTISAERREKADEKKGDWLLNERRYTRFLRSFTLPTTISEQAVNAKLENGVLAVTLDKREETKPRKITVS